MKSSILVFVAGGVAGLLFAACAGETPHARVTLGGEEPVPKGTTQRFDFTTAPPGKALPNEFIHVLGDWQLELDGPARRIAQIGEYNNPDFPRVFVKDKVFTNVHVKTRCMMIGGDTDRACGIMWRAQDSHNYFIARANALEDNVDLYKTVDGDRRNFAGKSITITPNEWHTLEAFHEGAKIRIVYDGIEVISAVEDTFKSGKVGIWTKADSVTAFDDFEATEL